MSRLIKATFTVLVLCLPTLVWAQGKIVVLDSQRAVGQADITQQRLQEMQEEAEFKTTMTELERLAKEREDLVEQFKKDAETMSQEKKEAAALKVRSKEADMKHLEEKLNMIQQRTLGALQKEVGPLLQEAVAELVAAEGIGLVLQAGAVAWGEPSYDITDKVTDKLNQAAAK